LTATNGNVGPAYATQITNFTLTQIWGSALFAEDHGAQRIPDLAWRYRNQRRRQCDIYRQRFRLQSLFGVRPDCAVEFVRLPHRDFHLSHELQEIG
jgi:hypothetical protein